MASTVQPILDAQHNDLLITLIIQKTTGPLQQHLRLNVRNINTFTEALEIVYSYIKSRHLVVPSRNDGPVAMDIGALKGRKGYGKGKGKGKGGMYKGKGKGFKGKGMFKGKGKGKSKGFKGMKGKGKGQGCFICGDPNHWSKECSKGKGRMSALTEEEGQQEGNQEEWSQDAEWYGDEWDEYDWNQDWIGSLDDWSGDWSWSEDDWSYWSDDWSWGSQDWWSAEQPSASVSSGWQSTANVPQDPTKSEPLQNVAAVTVETQDQNAARPSRTVRGAKPGMMTNLFVGACLLIGALSAGVPPVPSLNVPENDRLGCDDKMVEFHMQAGLVDKSWILFDSGACPNCCPEWFAPDYPILCSVAAKLVWKDVGSARPKDCAA